jgi:hypothetical protein
MKTCSNCGWWEFPTERGTWGQCAHPDSTCDPHAGTGGPLCGAWLPRCTECGEPAYTELCIYSDDEPPISAHYCDECAEELGVGRVD